MSMHTFIFFFLSFLTGFSWSNTCFDVKNLNNRQDSLLWKVEREGEVPNYLFGTIHVSGTWVELMLSDLQSYFEASKGVILELEWNDLVRLKMLRLMLLEDGLKLSDFLYSNEMKRVKSILKGRVSDYSIEAYKPWVVFVHINLPKTTNDRSMDFSIQRYFSAAGKFVYGLESPKEQVGVFNQLSYQDQAKLVRTVLKFEHKQKDFRERMFSAYRSERLWELWALQEQFSASMGDDFVAIEHGLIVERNVRMSERLDEYLLEGGYFVAVGALHLTGPDGLICLLREKGYTVTAERFSK